MSKETYTAWDSAEFLEDDEARIEYLKAALGRKRPGIFRQGGRHRGPGNPPGPAQPVQSAVGRARPSHRHGDEGSWCARCPSHCRTKSGLTLHPPHRATEMNAVFILLFSP